MYINEHELVSYASKKIGVTSLIGFTRSEIIFCLYFQCMKLQNSSSLNNPAVDIQEVGMTFSYTKDVSNIVHLICYSFLDLLLLSLFLISVLS